MRGLPSTRDLPETYKPTEIKEILDDMVSRIIGDLFDKTNGHKHDATSNNGPMIPAGSLPLVNTVTGLTWTALTSTLSLTSGYFIPTTAEQTNWNNAYNLSHAALTENITGLKLTGQLLELDTNYFIPTNAIIRGLFSETITGIEYDNTTGITKLTTGVGWDLGFHQIS